MSRFLIYSNNNNTVEFIDANPGLGCEVKWVGAPALGVLTAARKAICKGCALADTIPELDNSLANPFRKQAGRPEPLPDLPAFLRSRTPSAPQQVQPEKPKAFNPYLSIVVAPLGAGVDFASVQRIDEMLAMYKKNARLRLIAHNDEAISRFQQLDLELLKRILLRILR